LRQTGILPSMDATLRARAEARLESAAAELGLADPRPPYRERLRRLRETDAAAFERAIRHYEEEVLAELASGDDPLAVWIAYGRQLVGDSVRATAIDADGRAAPARPPIRPGTLVLLIPDDTAVDVLVATAPTTPSPAQQATLDLLVGRSLSLSG
jgi:hypothetical protein